jgi:hypothetical protein
MNKQAIIAASQDVFGRFTETCSAINETALFEKPGPKWSVAENIRHLVIATNMTTLAYRLPLFMVRWVGGTPNRPSRTFDELKAKYYKKLSEGGRASARFVPKPIEVSYGKQKLMDSWNASTAKYLSALTAKRKEEDLDNYLVRHPLLGRITLRELCYFSIFHTEHHLATIKALTQKP